MNLLAPPLERINPQNVEKDFQAVFQSSFLEIVFRNFILYLRHYAYLRPIYHPHRTR